jgi:hypothetical protein
MTIDISRDTVWLANNVVLVFHDSRRGSRCEFESVRVEAHKEESSPICTQQNLFRNVDKLNMECNRLLRSGLQLIVKLHIEQTAGAIIVTMFPHADTCDPRLMHITD